MNGNNRARTCDPLLVRQVLSQLSYAPMRCETVLVYYNLPFAFCQVFLQIFFKNIFSAVSIRYRQIIARFDARTDAGAGILCLGHYVLFPGCCLIVTGHSGLLIIHLLNHEFPAWSYFVLLPG